VKLLSSKSPAVLGRIAQELFSSLRVYVYLCVFVGFGRADWLFLSGLNWPASTSTSSIKEQFIPLDAQLESQLFYDFFLSTSSLTTERSRDSLVLRTIRYWRPAERTQIQIDQSTLPFSKDGFLNLSRFYHRFGIQSSNS
jgi:hypothetical protein